MLQLNVKGDNETKELFCNALRGTGIYKELDVFIDDTERDGEFMILIGENNENDVSADVEPTRIYKGDEVIMPTQPKINTRKIISGSLFALAAIGISYSTAKLIKEII